MPKTRHVEGTHILVVVALGAPVLVVDHLLGALGRLLHRFPHLGVLDLRPHGHRRIGGDPLRLVRGRAGGC